MRLLKIIWRINGTEHLATELERLTAEVQQLRDQLNENNEQLRKNLSESSEQQRKSNASVLAITESHHKWAAESARQIIKIQEELSSILERAQKSENLAAGGIGNPAIPVTASSDHQP